MNEPKEINFMVGEDSLEGTIFYPEKLRIKNPAILFITGWTSNRARYIELAKLLNEIGYIVMTFDMRGHGTSAGDINTQTRQDFINDVLSAYDYLVDLNGVDNKDVSLVGSSFGSYLGAVLTSKRRVNRLVLRAPANYPDGDFDKSQSKHSGTVEILKWRYEHRDIKETISLRALHNFEGEVLVVESGADEIIPHQTIQNYIDSVKNKKRLTYIVMEGAPHSLTTQEFIGQYSQILYSWFEGNYN